MMGEIRMQAAELTAALDEFKAIIDARASLPVLTGLLLSGEPGRLELAGTNLETWHRLNVPAEVDGDGFRVVVPFVAFRDAFRSLLGRGSRGKASRERTARLQPVNDGRALAFYLHGGEFQHELELLPVEDFPTLPAVTPSASFTLPGQVLAAAAAQVLPATSDDQARPVLTGVLFEGQAGQVTLAATDSYRLAVRELPVDWQGTPSAALVPGDALKHAAKVLGGAERVTVGFAGPAVVFEADGRRVDVRAVEGEFPRFRSLVPDGLPVSATFDRSAMTEALDHLKPYTKENTPIRVELNGGLVVHGSRQGFGKGTAKVDAVRSGEDVTVGFNASYLAAGLVAAGCDRVRMECRDPLKPATLRNADRADGFVYLLMPVRTPG